MIAPILQHQAAQGGPAEQRRSGESPRALQADETAVAGHASTNPRQRFGIRFRYAADSPRGPTGRFEEFLCELPA